MMKNFKMTTARAGIPLSAGPCVAVWMPPYETWPSYVVTAEAQEGETHGAPVLSAAPVAFPALSLCLSSPGTSLSIFTQGEQGRREGQGMGTVSEGKKVKLSFG